MHDYLPTGLCGLNYTTGTLKGVPLWGRRSMGKGPHLIHRPVQDYFMDDCRQHWLELSHSCFQYLSGDIFLEKLCLSVYYTERQLYLISYKPEISEGKEQTYKICLNSSIHPSTKQISSFTHFQRINILLCETVCVCVCFVFFVVGCCLYLWQHLAVWTFTRQP